MIAAFTMRHRLSIGYGVSRGKRRNGVGMVSTGCKGAVASGCRSIVVGRDAPSCPDNKGACIYVFIA